MKNHKTKGGYSVPALLVLGILALSSCKTALIPNYTSVERLSKLNPGMNKSESLQTLDNVYPFDILNGEQDGCEVQWYKFKHLKQSIHKSQNTTRKGLRGGKEKYVNESDAYLVFKEGKLYSVHTSQNVDLAGLLASVAEVNNTCANATVKGCMDPESLNYNPDALENDGSCKYCECGFEKNPNYNPNRPQTDCNAPCVKIVTPAKKEVKSCGTCEIIDALKSSQSNVNINMNLKDLPAISVADEDKGKQVAPKSKNNSSKKK